MNRLEVNAINEEIRADRQGFIERCDARYDAMIRDTSKLVADNLKQSPIVLLAGPSGSGKTSTAQRIRNALLKQGIGSHSISLDDYYLSPAIGTYPRTEHGDLDLESPLGLDIPLLRTHLRDLAEGREIIVPHFNFKIHERDDNGARRLQLHADEVVVFEGLHALNPMFTERNPEAFGLYISTESDLYDEDELLLEHGNFRLLRRAVRDLYHRSAPTLETLSLWENVCRGERLYIAPYANRATVRFDTTFGYELPVLMKLAEAQFFALPDDAPQHDLVLAIQRAADRYEPIDPELVPQTSLLREEFML